MKRIGMGLMIIAAVLLALVCPAKAEAGGKVKSLRIFLLSTAVAGDQAMKGVGEWGFSALVEADGHPILFDTGRYPDTVARNAEELGINLAKVKDVVLSHNHNDHTGGLLTLRSRYSKIYPFAFQTVGVAPGIFSSRPSGYGELNPMIEIRPKFENTGGQFIEHERPTEFYPGVWVTGPIPRPHPERNYSLLTKVHKPDGEYVEDTLPENMSMVFDTDDGVVLLTGCGHAGLINELEYGMKITGNAKALAVVGGLHLYQKSDADLEWTAGKLREHGLKHLLGAHCTGLESVYTLRRLAGLDRKTCVVGSLGASFTLGKGIDPEALAK